MDDQLLDSFLRIQTSADKLSAFLIFNRITDEFDCTPNQLERFLISKGITSGIRTELLTEICNNVLAYCKEQTLVAVGQQATTGKDGYIRFIYDMKERDQRPAELEDGTVDFKEVNQLKNVQRGQLIAERVEAEYGLPGKMVTGETIAAKLGKQARFKVGKNVVVSGEQTAMYATIDGLITLTDKEKINVFPVYEVNGDVDYKTGNIDFIGTVVIRGNVLSGFKIKAAGDIRIIGGVEGAELESEGSIEIIGGIMAGNKGHVRANKTIKSSFIQDGNVSAGEDVLVSQSIMHSIVRAGRSVICSGSKGLIVGGTVQAADLVSARVVGNTMSTATAIEVGVRPEQRAELSELRLKLRQTQDSLDKSEKALTILDQLAASGQLTEDKMSLRIKLGATKRVSIGEMEEMRDRILEIEKTLEDTDRARVDVSHTIYGGIKIVIGRYTRYLKDPIQHVSFRYMDGDIVNVPIFP
ncbi:DUF342 domain-containing protein [Paenibacillus radicis (ex Gao et al. 2016)]|uniref:Flagellar Assembly Protein A N-terminal region domain-containing protein n=1 Tax=Paenibacillus radicis (ex Gao et al. 2016) TaxID=1737354 RepID=A0A917HJI9_9BACL|nr:FapA family protein [Paenibacillus radicis (ex Gao et al. 2016)]GGG80598.1 hypothetical protein GCM10010918_42200 [Paenibacillus radicis (ex Gao et al. 2016)]